MERKSEEVMRLENENRMLRETIRQLNETLHKMIEKYISGIASDE